MRLISTLIGLLILAFLAWPYVNVYRLSSAAAAGDQATLSNLIDLESVREVRQKQLEQQINNTVSSTGMQAGGVVSDILQGIGNLAANQQVDMVWVQQQMQGAQGPLWSSMNHAFFESPTRFVVRKGKLGENPTFIEMTMQDWYWRVTAIYE